MLKLGIRALSLYISLSPVFDAITGSDRTHQRCTVILQVPT